MFTWRRRAKGTTWRVTTTHPNSNLRCKAAHQEREKKNGDGLCLCVDTAVSRSTNTRSVCPANCEVPYGHKEHYRAEKYLNLSGLSL